MRARRPPPGRPRASPASRSLDSTLAPYDHELVATVLGPRRLVLALDGRPLLAVADRGHAVGVDPEVDEVRAGRVRSPLAQSEVVLDRSPLVRMPFDSDADVGELAQSLGLGLERLARVLAEVGAVEVEEDHVLNGAVRSLARESSFLLGAARGVRVTGVVGSGRRLGARPVVGGGWLLAGAAGRQAEGESRDREEREPSAEHGPSWG